jgi:hypothetical protein
MTDSIFVITKQEQQQIVNIRMMVDKISQALDNLSPEIREHIKYDIQVFKNESEYLTDMLRSIQ